MKDRWLAVLALVAVEPTSASWIAAELGLGHSSVISALYALQARGLVERVQRQGWRRAG